MKVTIYQEPCWLLEAAELVYGLVNQIPVEKLAGSGPYCIPPDQVRRIQAEACAGLDPLDELTQFYFRGVPLEGVSGRLSCLGCALLYSFWKLIIPRWTILSGPWRRTGVPCVNLASMWRELMAFL